MPTKQDFVNFVNSIPGAANALGDDLTKWLNNEIFGVEDTWFRTFEAYGASQELENRICCFLNIPSVGFDDFSNEKQKMADAYKSYVADAQAVVDAEQAETNDINAAIATATGAQLALLNSYLAVQTADLQNAINNLKTWQTTLANYMSANPGLT